MNVPLENSLASLARHKEATSVTRW